MVMATAVGEILRLSLDLDDEANGKVNTHA